MHANKKITKLTAKIKNTKIEAHYRFCTAVLCKSRKVLDK